MCLRAIKTKHYIGSAYPILSILSYNIGSLAASGSTLLVLRQYYTLNRLSSFRPAPPHPLATPLKGGKFDHRPERPKVLLRHCRVAVCFASVSFFFNNFRQPNYLDFHWTYFTRFSPFGSAVAVDELSEF